MSDCWGIFVSGMLLVSRTSVLFGGISVRRPSLFVPRLGRIPCRGVT